MEEKYTLTHKQQVIKNFIKEKTQKQYLLNKYILKLDIYSSNCWFCSSEIKSGKFCSLICDKIFHSNIKLFPNVSIINKVSCFSFEMLTKSSKEIFIKTLNDFKNYDDVVIYYIISYKTKINNYKQIQLTITYYKNYEIVYELIINLNLIFYKIKEDEKKYRIPSNNLIQEYEGPNKDIDDECLYCKKKKDKMYFFYLTKNFIMGKVCSEFCAKVFININEQYITLDNINFFNLPPVNIIKNKDDIEKIKDNNINNSEIIYITIIHKNFVEIMEMIY